MGGGEPDDRPVLSWKEAILIVLLVAAPLGGAMWLIHITGVIER